MIQGNALDLPLADNSIDAIVTSPTYGNRMADHHVAKDASRRNTYTHAIGRQLHSDNSGAMQWGDKYRAFHQQALHEFWRVLRPGGRMVINMKDHIRKGERQYVVRWWILAATRAGFRMVHGEEIELPGNRHGENGHVRVPGEQIMVFEKGM
jgi:tRNA G10  N-methylase Trm11